MPATEALWAQLGGVSYSATEDRRLIGALASPGVVTGLAITVASGRNVNVSAGTGIVPDGEGGAYLGYTTETTPLTIPASATVPVYLVVDADTALTTVVAATTPPTDPAVPIGSVKTTATGLDTTYGIGGIQTAGRLTAVPPALLGSSGQALYLPLTGGVVSGPVQATRLTVPGLFDVGPSAVPNAPEGVRLGGVNPTARHYAHATAKAASGSLNVIGSSALEAIHWNIPTGGNNVSDYSRPPFGGSDYTLRAGVDGYYQLGGHANFEHLNADDNANAIREVRLSVYNDGDADPSYETVCTERRPNPGITEQCPILGMVSLRADQHVRVRMFHNSAGSRKIVGARVFFRLIQAN